jgi:hypothetical protein
MVFQNLSIILKKIENSSHQELIQLKEKHTKLSDIRPKNPVLLLESISPAKRKEQKLLGVKRHLVHRHFIKFVRKLCITLFINLARFHHFDCMHGFTEESFFSCSYQKIIFLVIHTMVFF